MAEANNFSLYKAQFEADTGIKWETNIHAYIQYVQARLLDIMVQQQKAMLDKMTNPGIKINT